MRWILIVLIMCNGIYFLWHNYMLSGNTSPSGKGGYKGEGEAQTQIVLLKESNQLPKRSGQSPKTAKKSDKFTTNQDPAAMCWLIGPFNEVVSGKQAVGRFEAEGTSMELINLTTQGLPDYWVHLMPQVSRRAALKLLRELQSKQIDSFLITKGELENGISLGFFTDKKRARKTYDTRVEQGYDAIIKEVPRTYTQVWGVFDTSKYGKLTDELWEKIKEGNKNLEKRKKSCNTIASVGNLD